LVGGSVVSVQYGLRQFHATMQTNQTTKNLTRGLVEVVTDDFSEDDVVRLRDNLQELNRRVVPSYEDHDSSRDAISWFLKQYGMKYESEIRIGHDEVPKKE
jgi:hypothetical protein